MPGPRLEAAVSAPSSPAPQPSRQAQGLGGGIPPSPHYPSAVGGAEEGARCVCSTATAPVPEPTLAGLAPKGERAPSWDSRCARNDCPWIPSCSSSLRPARPLGPGVFVRLDLPRSLGPHLQVWCQRAMVPRAGTLGAHALKCSRASPAGPAWGTLALWVQTTFRAGRSRAGMLKIPLRCRRLSPWAPVVSRSLTALLLRRRVGVQSVSRKTPASSGGPHSLSRVASSLLLYSRYRSWKVLEP